MKRKFTRRKPKPALPPDDAPLVGRHPDCSDERFGAFMESVRAFEAAPTTTLARLLIRHGTQLPSPDTFTEESVHDTLWKVIRAMARHRHYLFATDHLSDLELYRHLWEETLNHPTEEVTPEMGNCACHIDLVSDGGEKATQAWLRYYASDFERESWAHEFPEDAIPDHADLPYDRDRWLPKPFV